MGPGPTYTAMSENKLSHDELAALVERAQVQLHDEIGRIAGDLHDDVGANLILCRMAAQRIVELAARAESPGNLEEISKLSAKLADTLDTAYRSLRAVVQRHTPELLSLLGLRAALADMVARYDEVHPACKFSLMESPQVPQIFGHVASVGHRLVQEALTNAVKHSKASAVTIWLRHSDDRAEVSIAVSDNGVGFDTTAQRSGVGLLSMRHRAASAGGSMTLESAPGEGTTLVFTLPATAAQP